MIKPGIYEQIINKDLSHAINNQSDLIPQIVELDHAEASKLLSYYLRTVVERGLSNLGYDDGLDRQIGLINEIINIIERETCDPTFDGTSIDLKAELLLALVERKNNIISLDKKVKVPRPDTSISMSSLFTGADKEPSMVTELKKEIASSDRIDMLVSFIKWSGLRLLMDEIIEFTHRGGQLRVITTPYVGATDAKAVEWLSRLNNVQVKISYDTKRTRLHAKTYVFYRETGFSTAYVGSSNLSDAAISSGLEWNMKVTAQDLPDTMRKIDATFESYWNSNEFEPFNETNADRFVKALHDERLSAKNKQSLFFNIFPYPFQQEILDRLNAERKLWNSNKNLVVAATGTGKTVVSAFDYKRFCQDSVGKPNRLLFVAHREEILKQSIECFRGILKDQNFGDLFVGNYRPDKLDHLFISIQSFQSQSLYEKTSPDFYDFIIVDEFHHAAAPTYQKLLEYYKPKILLGLTATPERMDGRSILPYFDNRIAAEVRLPEAINRKLLCPFQYFGITDTVDLSEVKWARGSYDRVALSNAYVADQIVAERRADMIVRSINKYVTELEEVKGLGFCVSIEHAKSMATQFTSWNIPSISLTAASSDEERYSAKKRLLSGEIKFIFVVDIYNEGVDIPEVNTVLFLRPTESLTIFIQQLGRGLRLAEGKECLTVLDFIGQANKQYRFEEKYSALLSNTARGVEKEIKDGFPSLPKGCYIQLERKAKEIIFNTIRNALGRKAGIISRIASFEHESGLSPSLSNFLKYYHMDIRSIYVHGSFSRLRAEASVIADFSEPDEDLLAKAFQRINRIDSRRWITFLLRLLPDIEKYDEDELYDAEKRMFRMLYFTIWQKPEGEISLGDMIKSFQQLKRNPCLYAEMLEILQYRLDNIDFVDQRNDLKFDCPLDLYCTYSRDQIMVALDFFKPSTVREGVKYLPEKMIDILFITLNKSDKDYSPTTLYNDYSINEWLFHWQSQSTTPENSSTGKRYINHKQTGNQILLFIRESKKDGFGNTESYSFLGTADYEKHQGSCPMNIVWKLHQPIPARFIKKTNQLIN